MFVDLLLKNSKLVVQDKKTLITKDTFVPLLTEFFGKYNDRTFVVLFLRCMPIFVSVNIKERNNSALKVVDVAIISWFERIESYHSDLRGILTKSPI